MAYDPTRPAQLHDRPLYTYKDAVDHLLDWSGGSPDSITRGDARKACLEAMRELANDHRWSFYYTHGRISTVASYSTGTIAYDHCVTPEHEALTRSGWKTHDQLSVGEEILAYDHGTETCSWQPIQAIHRFDYDGLVLDVYRKGRSVLRCTPNHRVPVFTRHRSAGGDYYTKEYVLAKNLTPEMTTPLAAPIETETGGAIDARLAAVLAWCVTDGHGLFNRKYHCASIVQSRKANPDKCDEIASLVGRVRPGNSPDMLRFPLTPEDRNSLRRLVRDKSDLTRVVAQMGVSEASAMVRAMILAEASTNTTNEQKVFTQWDNNAPVAEAFQVACLLAGKAANMSVGRFYSRNHKALRTRYQLPVRHSAGIKLAKGSEWVPYKGTVWCPQVSTTAWVVRCNGAVMITGNSGGASERMVTLTTGTWPTWARFGTLRINNVNYAVATRESSSVITLEENNNPGEDVASGTDYTIFRESYALPAGFKQLLSPLYDLSSSYEIGFVHPSAWLQDRRYSSGSGTPLAFTIMGGRQYHGQDMVWLSPAPSEARNYDCVYLRAARPLVTEEYSTGTVSCTASGTTLTGTGTAWTSAHKGAVLRLSSSTTAPTAPHGSNPAAQERIITAVASATSLTVDSAFDSSLTSVKHCISDPVDVDDVMLTLFLRTAEKCMGYLRHRTDIAAIENNMRSEMIRARTADSRWAGPRMAGLWPSISLTTKLLHSAPTGEDIE